MRLLRSPWVRAFLIWTAVLLAAAAVVGIGAVIGLLRAADECFFQTGPCSQAGDTNSVLLAIAFFGIPLIWLAGVLLGVLGRTLASRRRRRPTTL
jgi:hypothetical protein